MEREVERGEKKGRKKERKRREKMRARHTHTDTHRLIYTVLVVVYISVYKRRMEKEVWRRWWRMEDTRGFMRRGEEGAHTKRHKKREEEGVGSDTARAVLHRSEEKREKLSRGKTTSRVVH